MKIDRIITVLISGFTTLIATLFLVHTQSVFDPPYLLPLLNTLFLAIIPCFVAFTAARLFLSFGSFPLLLLGSGMLALGIGGGASGWFIGLPTGPNTTITIYNSGAFFCAFLSLCSAALQSQKPKWNPFTRSGPALTLCYLTVAVIMGSIVMAASNGTLPLFIVQGAGPTFIGRGVLLGAIAMFLASAAMITANRELSGLVQFCLYVGGFDLFAIGLTGVMLQHYVGSPLGWAGRSAQYSGACLILVGVAGLWRTRFETGKPLHATVDEIAQQRIMELEQIAALQEAELGQAMAERSSAEQNIRMNEERLRLALDAAHLATWDWHIPSGDIIWNDEHYRMLGYEPRSFSPLYQHWADRLDPDDLQATEELIQAAIEKTGEYRAQFRVIKPDGSIRTLEALGRIEKDASGTALRMYGAMSDITDKVQLVKELWQTKDELEQRVVERTAELSESESKYRILSIYNRTLIEASLDPLITIDASGKIADVNSATEQVTGYERQELIGSDFSDYFTDPQNAREGYRLVFREGQVRDYPLEIRHRAGRITPVLYNATVYRDNAGNVSGVFAAARDITKLKQAEIEREQFYKFFLASSDIMVIADPNGAFLKTNPACTEVLGYSQDELITKPFIEFIHPDDRQPTLEEMARQQQLGYTMAFENRYLCKDGSVRWLSWQAVYNRDENQTYATGRDITLNKHQEEALRKSEREFRLLAEAMPQIVWICDPAGKNIYFNQQWMGYTGLTLEESLGHGWNKPFHPDDQQMAWGAWQNAINNLAEYSLECRLRRADGVYKWWLVRGVPVQDDQGAVIKWFGTCTDIDEFKNAELERLSLEKQLLHAQKLESLGILAGGIAHDFNNILMAILGNAELARMKLAPESPLVPNLQQIEQAAMRAADLAKQMLAYSGKGKFIISKLNLNHIIEEMKSMLEVSISRKAILKLNLAPDLPSVEADSSQIQQIIMNLVINASEAIGAGCGFITIRTGSMECAASYLAQLAVNENMAAGNYVFLEITDTGSGMSKETQSRIFDPFFTTKFTGRGLGMAAVHGIIRGHRGGICIYSELGKGTSFKVLLPAIETAVGLIDTRSSDETLHGNGAVLLVDDEEVVLNISAEMLKELGFSVIVAKDGVEALELYKSGVAISCVILDLTMPRMDGEQCFRELRQLDPAIKIIMSSGYNEQEIAEKFENLGVNHFIQKPYNFSELKAALKSVLYPL